MSQNELSLDAPAPRWDVITIHKKQSRAEIAAKAPKIISHHELIFEGKVQLKRKMPAGLATLRDMAAFLNSRGMVPQEKVQCLADVGLPPLKKTKTAPTVEEPAEVPGEQ